MKPINVLYATREGQTKRIAEHLAARLRSRGLQAEAHNVKDRPDDIDLNRCGAAVLAASVHIGRHEAEMVEFVKSNLVQLGQIPTAFLSVTLSEAGAERTESSPEQRARSAADVQKMIEDFCRQTGLRPKYVKPVAGSLLYTKYGFIVRFVMKQIAKRAGGGTDTSRDYEYTDWIALDRFTDRFAEEISR